MQDPRPIFDNSLGVISPDIVLGTLATLDVGYSGVTTGNVIDFPVHQLSFRFTPTSPAMVIAEAHLRGVAELSMAEPISRAVATWNSERIDPTAMLSFSDEGRIQVRFRCALPVENPTSQAQLAAFMRTTIDSTQLAVHNFIGQFPQLAQERPLNHHDEVSTEEPVPLTLARVRHVLAQMGITHCHSSHGCVMSWVNDVLVGLYLVSGPSLLVRAFWDPQLPRQELMRATLQCNKLNEDNPYTKAYCLEEEDGLHLRVEFVVHAGTGLTGQQLQLCTSLAVHTVLMGIDALAVELGYDSPVAWPK